MYENSAETGHTVSNVPGWEGFRFENIEVQLVDGIPCLIGLHIKPIPGQPLAVLRIERERAARLPVSEIISVVAPFSVGGQENAVFSALQALEGAGEAGRVRRPRGGSLEFSRAVAAVVTNARATKASTVSAVAETFLVSMDRANQYIAEARNKYGLLGDGRRRPSVTTPKEKATYSGTPRPFDENDQREWTALVTSPEFQKRKGRSPGKGSTAHQKGS